MSDLQWDSVKECIGEETLFLGPQFAYQARYTPRHLSFVFSRYKFASKLLHAKSPCRVLELGCGEGIGGMLLAEMADAYVGVDFDKDAISYAQKNLGDNEKFNVQFIHGDIVELSLGKFQAAVSLDVIEHIIQEKEDAYVKSLYDHLDEDGFCCVGTPNTTADKYASEMSRRGHVNMFEADRLQSLLQKYFQNVFIFGMNDEVVHTGFHPMCHYLMALACGKRKCTG